MAVLFDVSISVDGFITGPNVSLDNPMGDGGERLHDWMFAGKSERESTDYQESVFAPVGALLMGRRMLDLGIGHWGDNPTFHAPVFVVTHEAHAPIEKRGGTSFSFVTEGFDEALRQAREAAGDRDVQIAGGADIVRQAIAAGVVEEIRLHLVPVLLGSGTRLFAADQGTAQLDLTSAEPEPEAGVIHLRYRLAGAGKPTHPA